MTLNVSLSHLKYILQLSSVKFSVSLTFFGMGRDRTDGHMDIWTDRLLSENTILDRFEDIERYLFN